MGRGNPPKIFDQILVAKFSDTRIQRTKNDFANAGQQVPTGAPECHFGAKPRHFLRKVVPKMGSPLRAEDKPPPAAPLLAQGNRIPWDHGVPPLPHSNLPLHWESFAVRACACGTHILFTPLPFSGARLRRAPFSRRPQLFFPGGRLRRI